MPPFWPGEGSFGQQQMYMRIVNGKYTFDNPEWQSVSTRTRQLVQTMVSVPSDCQMAGSHAFVLVAELVVCQKL